MTLESVSDPTVVLDVVDTLKLQTVLVPLMFSGARRDLDLRKRR